MHKYKGQIIAHIGPMFGGKTSGLLADVRKMRIAKYNVALFKPTMDNRYSKNEVVNHDGESVEAIRVKDVFEITDFIESNPKIDVIAIDEFQFIKGGTTVTPNSIVQILIDLVYKKGKTLIVSGLDLDSELNPFCNVKELLPYATHIFKHKAVCVDCGSDATTSYCNVAKSSKELVGGSDIYEPLCIKCYIKRG